VRPRNEGEEVKEKRSIPTNVLGGRACRTKVGPERSLVEDAITNGSIERSCATSASLATDILSILTR
jgi:hypothetical protein